jgi:ankyrin repeat protein
MDATLDDRIEALHDVRSQQRIARSRASPGSPLLRCLLRVPPPPPYSPSLSQCARFGEAEDVSSLLASGVQVDAVDGTGRTALFCAAANGHLLVLQLLLTHGAVRVAAAMRSSSPLRWLGPPGYWA